MRQVQTPQLLLGLAPAAPRAAHRRMHRRRRRRRQPLLRRRLRWQQATQLTRVLALVVRLGRLCRQDGLSQR